MTVFHSLFSKELSQRPRRVWRPAAAFVFRAFGQPENGQTGCTRTLTTPLASGLPSMRPTGQCRPCALSCHLLCPFSVHFVSILGPFWVHFGTARARFYARLSRFFGTLCVTLCHFVSLCVALCHLCHFVSLCVALCRGCSHGPLPTIFWAYPVEFKSKAAAGQMRESPFEFSAISAQASARQRIERSSESNAANRTQRIERSESNTANRKQRIERSSERNSANRTQRIERSEPSMHVPAGSVAAAAPLRLAWRSAYF